MHSERASWGLKLAAWGGLLFLHFPILIIFLYAFNTEDAAFSFPPKGFTLHWFSVAFSRPDVLEAIVTRLPAPTGDREAPLKTRPRRRSASAGGEGGPRPVLRPTAAATTATRHAARR